MPEKEEKPTEQTEEKKPQAAEKSPEKKHRKISRMTLTQVDSELKKVKEKMGANQSSFARHLLARKKELS